MRPATPPSSRSSRSAASAALSPGSTCPLGKIHCLGSFFALTRRTSAEAPCPRTTTAPAWWTDGNEERLQQPDHFRIAGICRTDYGSIVGSASRRLIIGQAGATVPPDDIGIGMSWLSQGSTTAPLAAAAPGCVLRVGHPRCRGGREPCRRRYVLVRDTRAVDTREIAARRRSLPLRATCTRVGG